jgi:hypothetical protein
MLRREGMFGDQQILNDATSNEMLLDDPFEGRRIALPIPRAFGIDDSDRPAFADSKAVGLAAKDPPLLG